MKEVARGQQLPARVVAELVARTDGVPLFVEEMTRMVVRGGDLPSIPVTLHELLLARLDTLPPRQKARGVSLANRRLWSGLSAGSARCSCNQSPRS